MYEDQDYFSARTENIYHSLQKYLPSYLGYEGSRPSGALSKFVLLMGGGGGTAEHVELVLLALFSLSESRSF